MRPRRAPDSLVVDDMTFAVRWSDRRATVGITVARDGLPRVAAPRGLPSRSLEVVLRAKLPWVRRKLEELALAEPAVPATPRSLADGELLPYLGRQYRLVRIATRGDGRPVRLRRGRIEVAVDPDGDARAAVVAWYTARARDQFARRVARYAPLVGVAPAAIVVRDLGRRRWGICSTRTATVSFHWELVAHAPDVVDYVVVHELTHLLEPNHQAAFWRRVERILPDWRARRRRLSRSAPQTLL